MENIKLPKSINVQGYTWKIEKVKDSNGGSFKFSKNPVIKIGTENPLCIVENFLHEVLELILLEQMCRFSDYHEIVSNETLMFVMNHNQFEIVVKQLAGFVSELISLNQTASRKQKSRRRRRSND